MRPSIDKVCIVVNSRTHEFKEIMATNLIIAIKEDGTKYTVSDLLIDKRNLEERVKKLERNNDILTKGYLNILEILKANNVNIDILKQEVL